MMLIIVTCLVSMLGAEAYRNNNYNINDYYYPYPYYGDVKIQRYDNENYGNGRYRFAYEQTDGQKREEYGGIVNQGQPDEHLAVRGSYSWMDPNGVNYRVNYVADDNGYQPEIEEGPGGGVPPAVVASLLG